MLKYKDVAEILGMIDSSSCDEFILESEGVKLVVRRNTSGTGPAPEIQAPQSTPPATPGGATPSEKSRPAAPKAASGQADGFVGAPMVGTFYRAPAPDKPAYVEVGTKVKAGDPIGVIEVMKLFTTIHAEIAGTVRQIGVENAQFVEFGQMLFIIDPE